jgi:hypothetical protein
MNMKRIFGLLVLGAIGISSLPVLAGEARVGASGDNATIQEIDMKVDQYGDYNGATMSGTLRNSTTGGRAGSIGTVQRGTSSTVQTGEGNRSTTDFTIENRTRYDRERKPGRATVRY